MNSTSVRSEILSMHDQCRSSSKFQIQVLHQTKYFVIIISDMIFLPSLFIFTYCQIKGSVHISDSILPKHWLPSKHSVPIVTYFNIFKYYFMSFTFASKHKCYLRMSAVLTNHHNCDINPSLLTKGLSELLSIQTLTIYFI